jgi:hypothetical protein
MHSLLRLTRFGYIAALAVVVFVLASARDTGAQPAFRRTVIINPNTPFFNGGNF